MAKEFDLSVKVGALELKNPLIAASGTFGYGSEFADFVDPSSYGAIAVKGLSLNPKEGNPMPRIVETSAGMLNAIGLENVGLRRFIEEKLDYLRTLDTKVIANFFGNTVEDYAAMASCLSEVEGIHALEMNISCPNVKAGGIAFGTDPLLAAEVVGAAKKAANLPLIVKLSPNVTDIKVLARAVEEAGADAISLINTITGMAVNLDRQTPALANVTGGLSGPAIKPVALRMTWEALSAVKIPVIGLGGIVTGEDALEFLCLGACAVQIGTANFIKPLSVLDILSEIEHYLTAKGIGRVTDFIGTFRIP
ncbi:MAG: dihydroorotate dehydrogenase [Deltaproteobacteria bacterium]|nr:MAG: dihydroorotate dehydrogenase [Deltaproteobacteria bacterium]